MSKKKTSIEEWNKDLFQKMSGKNFNKITKIIPHFITWTSDPEEADVPSEWREVKRIDLEFEDGSKVSIIPKSNKEEDEELSLALDVVQYRPESINWRQKK